MYLPTVASAGEDYVIVFKYVGDPESQYMHLLPNTADTGVTIDGYTYLYSSNAATCTLINDGRNWWSVSGYIFPNGSGLGILYGG